MSTILTLIITSESVYMLCNTMYKIPKMKIIKLIQKNKLTFYNYVSIQRVRTRGEIIIIYCLTRTCKNV